MLTTVSVKHENSPENDNERVGVGEGLSLKSFSTVVITPAHSKKEQRPHAGRPAQGGSAGTSRVSWLFMASSAVSSEGVKSHL